MSVNIIQQQDPSEQIVFKPEKRERTPVLGKSDTKDNSRADRNIADRIVSLAIFFTSGATVAGGLSALVFDGWPVALAALVGGVWGMFVAALCQVASEEPWR